ncbi:MAG: hypothetical protein WC052_04350 [Patescibacteria group bacterium]
MADELIVNSPSKNCPDWLNGMIYAMEMCVDETCVIFSGGSVVTVEDEDADIGRELITDAFSGRGAAPPTCSNIGYVVRTQTWQTRAPGDLGSAVRKAWRKLINYGEKIRLIKCIPLKTPQFLGKIRANLETDDNNDNVFTVRIREPNHVMKTALWRNFRKDLSEPVVAAIKMKNGDVWFTSLTDENATEFYPLDRSQ